jgi:hypothetical protein
VICRDGQKTLQPVVCDVPIQPGLFLWGLDPHRGVGLDQFIIHRVIERAAKDRKGMFYGRGAKSAGVHACDSFLYVAAFYLGKFKPKQLVWQTPMRGFV